MSKLTSVKIINYKSVGTCDPQSWINEGDGLIAAAKCNRELWRRRRKKYPPEEDNYKVEMKLWKEMYGLSRSSMLLLGYAVEMYLKAGLVKVYRNTPEILFKKEVRQYFKHNYFNIAKEIDFPFHLDDEKKFETLKSMVLYEARYPVDESDSSKNYKKENDRIRKFWDDKYFKKLVKLVNRVFKHVSHIDSDETNPAIFTKCTFGLDGYISLRFGGNLQARIIYKYSSDQKSDERKLQNLKKIIDYDERLHLMQHYWFRAKMFEDKKST